MAINKVIYGNDTLIDLTSDTATEDKVLSGYTFHKATGEVAVGTASGGGDIPNGKTVTPTDDIQTWLHCAGIFDNNYTTLAEVLNDLTIYNALLSDANACDYMARSTTWAGVTGGLVPTMTSDATPSGQALVNNCYNNTFLAYKAFDNDANTSTVNQSSTLIENYYLGYKFTEPTVCNKISIYAMSGGDGSHYYDIAVYGSNDFTTFKKLSDELQIKGSSPNTKELLFNNDDSYLYYVIKIVNSDVLYSHVSGTYALQVYGLQFYFEGITTNQDAMRLLGKYDYACELLLNNPVWIEAICNSESINYVLNTYVPQMTSATSPKGVANASSVNGNNPAWHVFDGNLTNMWHALAGLPQWVSYEFTEEVNIRFVKLLTYSSVGGPKVSKIQYSNDGSNWFDYSDDFSFVDCPTPSTWYSKIYYSDIKARYYRIYITECNYITGGNYYAVISELQFYGRTPVNKSNYVPLVPTMTSNTTPSGECIRSSIYSSGYEAFKAFDKNNSTWWNANGGAGEWIGYTFENPVILNKLYLNAINTTKVGTLKLQGSNDGFIGDINDITSQFTPSAFPYVLEFDNNVQYESYRIINISGTTDFNMYEIQFYAKRNPEPAIIHCATDDEITITAEDFERTIYAYGDTATLPSDIPSGLYTFTSAVLSNPSYPDQPYTQNVYITEHTTEIYFMPENMETVLWTNSAPTSAFASQNVTLSDGMSNYKYLKLKWKNINSGDQIGELIVPVDNFKSQSVSPNYNNFSGMFTTASSYARGWVYLSDTQITFGNCYTLAGTTQNSNYCIPLEITGLNKLRTGKKSSRTVTTLWTNPSPSASAGFASQNVTLSDNISNYDYIEFEFFQNVAKMDDIVVVAFPTEQLKNKLKGSNWYGSSATIFAGNYYYTRYIRCDSETSILISSGLKSKSGSSGSTFATSIIPNKIYGIKYE